MKELEPKIQANGLEYTLVGDYYLPNIAPPSETRDIGRWGRLHKEYLEQHKPIQYSMLTLNGGLWTYLADLNEQARDRLDRIIQQMKEAEHITEALKAADPMLWVQSMNSIRNRAEEIILAELIYV